MSSESPDVITALISLCRQYAVRTVLQVGAEDGYEADCIRRELGCRAVCIEPDTRCGPVSHLLEWHEVLIGEGDGVTDFYLHATTGLSSKIQRHTKETLARIPQMRLDAFCRRHEVKPDCLIIDCEGTTLEVLRSAGPMLGFVSIVYCEVQHDDSHGPRNDSDVYAYLETFGLRKRDGAPSYCAGSQSNWCFVR